MFKENITYNLPCEISYFIFHDMLPKILFYTFFLIVHCLIQTKAQTFPKDVWHEGEITLFSGETLTGLVKYNLETDNVQIRLGDGVVKSYGARTVESFEFLDAIVRIQRTFFTLPYQKMQGYETPTFFELLTDGKLALLNRETVVVQQVPTYGYMGVGMPFANISVLTDNYYFLVKTEQKVVKFYEKKVEIFALMQDKQAKIENYFIKNSVQLGRRKDLMTLVDFYNAN